MTDQKDAGRKLLRNLIVIATRSQVGEALVAVAQDADLDSPKIRLAHDVGLALVEYREHYERLIDDDDHAAGELVSDIDATIAQARDELRRSAQEQHDLDVVSEPDDLDAAIGRWLDGATE